MLNYQPASQIGRFRTEMLPWLNQYNFDLYVTLASNGGVNRAQSKTNPHIIEQMTDRLKHWDAMINFDIHGKGWNKNPDRLFAFWFVEKVGVNPHWHGLLRFGDGDEAAPPEYSRTVHEMAQIRWRKCVPSGTAEVIDIYGQPGVVEYVTKELSYRSSFDGFVLPGQFGRASTPS